MCYYVIIIIDSTKNDFVERSDIFYNKILHVCNAYLSSGLYGWKPLLDRSKLGCGYLSGKVVTGFLVSGGLAAEALLELNKGISVVCFGGFSATDTVGPEIKEAISTCCIRSIFFFY